MTTDILSTAGRFSFTDRLRKLIKEDGITLLIVFLLVAAYALLRTRGDTFSNLEALKSSLVGTQPTVIEFYSNNCSICLTSKPKVMQLERDLVNVARVLKLDIKEPVNAALASQWGLQGVPAFFVVDTQGQIIYARAGAPDIQAITQNVYQVAQRE